MKGQFIVSRSAEQKAALVFDEFTTAYLSGQSPRIADYVLRCPASERERLGEALAGFVFSYENYAACQLSDAGVQSALERLQRARLRRKKLAEAQSRAFAESWEQTVTEPLARMTTLLYPGPGAADARVGVMNRVAPGTAPTSGGRLDRLTKKSAEQVAQTGAERLLSRAGVDSFPVPLTDIADQLCLLVQEAPLESLEGCLVTDGHTGGILLNANCQDRRRRFTFAHELGHYVLHRQRQGSFHDQEKELFSPSSRVEFEASAFASYLLMPPALLPNGFGQELPRFSIAETVAADFNVSLMAVLKRLVKESSFLTVFICSEDTRVKWYDFSSEIEGYNGVVSQLPERSAAYALARDEAVDVYTRRLPAEAWFNKGPLAQQDLYVTEESRRFATGHVYTLINVEYR